MPPAGDGPAPGNEDASVRAPSITLPKGGGAIRGIGEKFAANPVTGTGSMTVPIATSPGRAGFGPQLSLTYDSGAGNGPYGLGWSLSLPSISRKTDKGLPRYEDAVEADEQDSDVFILSGSEDLVPVGQVELDGYRVRRFRPRVEGLFSRIERWTRIADSTDVHWRSISKDNVLTVYGADSRARISDPRDARRVFTWLVSETRDDKGNAILYRYEPEDGAGVDLGLACERNRGPRADVGRKANRYLKRIFYGNRVALLDAEGRRPRFLDERRIEDELLQAKWMFEVVFDYGDHDPAAPAPEAVREWSPRPDPFSSYRAGFEVRTVRRCHRVLMFHHFPDVAEVGRGCLVRSTELSYADEREEPASAVAPVYTFLRSVTHAGHRMEGTTRVSRRWPPVELEYTEPTVQDAVQVADADTLANLPSGVDGTSYRWTDLHGEGVPGIVSEQAGAWFYRRNVSPLAGRGLALGPLERVAVRPGLELARGGEFMDLAGDGLPDLVVLDGPVPGFYEHDEAEGWEPFRPLTSRLSRDMRDPNQRLVDLDGDGHADVLITEDDALVWHASLGEAGFGPARRVAKALDEERGPRLVLADGTGSVYLADLSGDGLPDLVRIRNGEVCYWPNLGYGRFGAKVTMDHAPLFDRPERFDHRRLRLADIDGSGTTDLVYLHPDGVRLYFNQSGNAWSPPRLLSCAPRVDDSVSISVADLLGNGTACLVWSSPLPGDARRQLRYVDLMGGQKPHLLVKAVNNLGAETHVTYASSSTFYLRDRRDGRPWLTRLPFPVHVVERVETRDEVSRNRFVTSYAYHHGHYDGEEREFRGFGMVEQWDAEELAAVIGADTLPGGNDGAGSHVPPVHTKTWFHTGVHLGRDRVSRHFETEYFREPGLTADEARRLLLEDTVVPPGLTPDEEREACRALKGSMLRQEVYADDAGHAGATPDEIQRARTPYTVTEQSFGIRLLQPRGENRHGVFLAHPREALTYHYERNPADPRVQHTLTLEVDDFGNVLEQAAVAYGRRQPDAALPTDADRDRQALIHVTHVKNGFTNAISEPDDHRTPLPAESATYELRKAEQDRTGTAGVACPFRFDDLRTRVTQSGDGAHDVADEDLAFEGAARTVERNPADRDRYFRRRIAWSRTLYRDDHLTRLLPLHDLQSLALPGETYRLALTGGLLDQVFRRPKPSGGSEVLLPDPAAVLAGEGGSAGGYLQSQSLVLAGLFPATGPCDDWWIPSGRTSYVEDATGSGDAEWEQARQHFFLPRRYQDPFGQSTTVRFDDDDLLMVETRDPLGNCIRVELNDYRVLQPRLVSDPNGNRTEAAYDALGLVVGTAVMGKPDESPPTGDALGEPFLRDLPRDGIDAFLLRPRQASPRPDESEPAEISYDLLGNATTRIVYDLHRFRDTKQASPDDPTAWQPSFAAIIARETHVSDLADGEKPRLQISFGYSDGFGREIQKKIQAEPGPLDLQDPAAPRVSPRWVGSGWTIFNNKGKPVRQYEPFFSATHGFEFGVTVGVSPVLFYDPAERVIATLHPNHTYEKVVFDPWQQTTHDVNDTCAPHPGLPGVPALPAQTGDPRTDPDTRGYVAGYFEAMGSAAASWQTWFRQREAGAPEERIAARKAADHANTPTTAHLDALGRPFLTVARNRVVCPGHDLDGTEEDLATRVELDIQGHQRAVRDAVTSARDAQGGAAEDPLGRVVMRYAFDLLGNRIHQLSMEGGARWTLNDVAGKPLRAWDGRGHDFTIAYDALRRPVARRVRGTTAASDPRTLDRDLLVERIEYGEGEPDPEALNLRTRVLRHFDSAGVVTNAAVDPGTGLVEAYDFKGNLLRSSRQLASDYAAIPDWSAGPALDAETFTTRTRFDALNRPVQSVAPHGSLARARRNVIQPVFNEANLLERVDVWLGRAAEPQGLLDRSVEAPSPVGVSNIDRDAKGLRQRIEYQNGTCTLYAYDRDTHRLVRLLTKRDPAAFPDDCPDPPPAGWPGCQLQHLGYTYDPAGNITHIQDDAQQTIYFGNLRVEPSSGYTYDALYRLVEATGREHVGQTGACLPHSHDDAGRVGILGGDGAGHFSPHDGGALGRYVERYSYDSVGNFLELQHDRTDLAAPGWARSYTYAERSLVEDGSDGGAWKVSNRLSSTTVGGAPEAYEHDAHGNMVRMPHLGGGAPGPNTHWDYQDRLRRTDLGGGGTAHHVYDASGERVRKVWVKAPGLVEERIYLGGFELFRRHAGPIGMDTPVLERETLHVMDDRQRIAVVETRTLDVAGDDPAPERLVRYQLGNHLGSASLELDDEAQIVSYEEYAPYGSTTYQAVRSQTESPKRYRFTGKERDEESGLYYYGARHYAPWLGRWSSCDPAGLDDGVNRYQYARSAPNRLVDPTGLKAAAPTPDEKFVFGGEKGGTYGGAITVGPKQVRFLDEHDKPFVTLSRETFDEIMSRTKMDLAKATKEFSSSEGLRAALVETYYRGFDGGNVLAPNWVGQGQFRFEQSFQNWAHRGPTELQCFWATALNQFKSMGLVPPTMSSGEFEDYVRRTRLIERGKATGYPGGPKPDMGDSQVARLFERIAGRLSAEHEWAQFTGMDRKVFTFEALRTWKSERLRSGKVRYTLDFHIDKVRERLKQGETVHLGYPGHYVLGVGVDEPASRIVVDDPLGGRGDRPESFFTWALAGRERRR